MNIEDDAIVELIVDIANSFAELSEKFEALSSYFYPEEGDACDEEDVCEGEEE